jgi:intracellular sulfur oxidation DsrE/DsrF family protein
MIRAFRVLMSVPVLLMVLSSSAWAQLPVPDVGSGRDVPGAAELPDPSLEYKILYMVGAAPKPTDVNPTLIAAGRLLNTLAAHGVPADKRKFAVMIRGGLDIILKNEAYKARHDGQDNPNVAIIQALKKAGVEIRVCGQGVSAMKLNRADIMPEVQVDYWALTTRVNLELRGYVILGG